MAGPWARRDALGDNHRMLGLPTRHTNVRERRIESGVVTLILGRKAA